MHRRLIYGYFDISYVSERQRFSVTINYFFVLDDPENKRPYARMPLDTAPQVLESVSKTHFDLALTRASWLFRRFLLRDLRSDSGLHLFIAGLGLLIREARRDPETANAICRRERIKALRLEVRMTRLIAGPRKDKQDQTHRWANAAAYIAHPPNNDVPPPTWREAVRYIERRGGMRKLSNLYAKRAVAGGENGDDIDRAFTPPDLRGYYTNGKEVNTEWYTPAALFAAMNCQFDLDPASPGAELVPWIPAGQHYTKLDDGLTRPWFGFVFCNPPYGRSCLSKWVRKFVEHGNGIILVSDRTSTRWYQELLEHADLILMLRKKLRFENGTNNMRQFPIGTHLIAIGPKGLEALVKAFRSGLGFLVQPYRPDAP